MRKRLHGLTREIPVTLLGALAVAFGACPASKAAADDAARPELQLRARPELIRAAVNRALPLLVKASSVEYPLHRSCFSCHNQAVPAVALALARQRGFAVDPATLRHDCRTHRG